VHRKGAGHVGDDDGKGPALRGRQVVGQTGEEPRHQRVRHTAGDFTRRDVVAERTCVHLEGAAAEHERQLETEQFVEHEAAPGGVDDGERLGPVDGVE